jgi:hypothetical protein
MFTLFIVCVLSWLFGSFFTYVLDLPKDERIIEDVPAFVAAFRQSLIIDDLLPEKHDDYHMMLRCPNFFC